MYLDLKCPSCGFAFQADIPDDMSTEDVEEIKTCPCGCMMTEVNDDKRRSEKMG